MAEHPQRKPVFTKEMSQRPRSMRTLSEAHLPECPLRDRSLSPEKRLSIGCLCESTAPEWTL